MSKIDDGGPAFPRHGYPQHAGMSLRDYFAAKASDQDVSFQGEILREKIARSKGISVLPDDWRVTSRYMHADAMLAARKSHQPEQQQSAGWIEWNGGECPVQEGVSFFIKFRDGYECDAGTGYGLVWDHYGNDSDIIAYRIVSNGDQK